MRNALRSGSRAASLLAFTVLKIAGAMLVWLNMHAIVLGRIGRTAAAVRVRRVVDRAVGVVLIGLGVRLAFEDR